MVDFEFYSLSSFSHKLRSKLSYYVVSPIKKFAFFIEVNLSEPFLVYCGPGSSVSIANGYGLDGPGIECWCGARFSSPVQTDPGAHPASCTMGTGSFPGVKSDRGVMLTPHPLLVPWS